MHSFNETPDHYRPLPLAQQEGRLQLPADNFDTGELTEPGTCPLTDKSYSKLLDKVNDKSTSIDLRQNISDFYADLRKPYVSKKKLHGIAKTYSENWRL
jgi:hypothetical protein